MTKRNEASSISQRRWLFRLMALLLIPSLLLAAELFLRLRRPGRSVERGTAVWHLPDDELGYRLIPGGMTPDGLAFINDDGIRGDSLHLASSPGTPRLMILGNSCAFGAGVADTAIFSTLLEKALRAKGYPETLVFNAGVGGYNSEQCRHHLDRLWRFEPTHLILYFGWNDLVTATWPFYVPHVQMGPAIRPQNAPRWLTLLEGSRLFWSVRSRWRGLSLRLFRSDGGVDAVNERYIEDFRANVAAIVAAAEARGVKVLLCRLPYDPARAPRAYSEDAFKYTPAGYRALWTRFQGILESFGERHAIVDLPKALGDEVARPEVIYDYNHLGEEGHRLVAEELARTFLATQETP